MNSRYQGKPLLRLIECYVLWAINELSEKDGKNLTEMAPKLREVYGIDGKWNEIIGGVMSFPDNMPELVRDMWARNQEVAMQKNTTLSPEQFAQIFVDQNFPQ